MEEKKPNFWKSALYWGGILGLALIILSVLFYVMNLSLETWVSWVTYLLFIGGIVISTINYRKSLPGGGITYGQALGFGVAVISIAVIISAIYSFIFMQYIDPTYIDKIMQLSEEKLLEGGMPEEQIELAIEMQKKMMKPWLISLISIPSSIFFGFIFSLITSIFLQKKPAEFKFED